MARSTLKENSAAVAATGVAETLRQNWTLGRQVGPQAGLRLIRSARLKRLYRCEGRCAERETTQYSSRYACGSVLVLRYCRHSL
jgi:hypothetical protein